MDSIGSRWVNAKDLQLDEFSGRAGVRMRVIQEIATSSAAQGYSSGTRSNEAVRTLLTLGSKPEMGLAALDVGAALLHSPFS